MYHSRTTNVQVRIYEVQPTGTTVPKASYSHEGPALCVAWSKVKKGEGALKTYVLVLTCALNRMAIRSFQVVRIKQLACLMSQQVNQFK